VNEQSKIRFDIALHVCELLKEYCGENLVSVVLYGSVARGTARRDSDIDLLFVFETMPQSAFERDDYIMPVLEKVREMKIAQLFSQGIFTDFSYVIKTRKEATYHSPLYLDMVEDAKMLFDRDGFFAGILSDMKARMTALGSRRVFVGEKWYWILKPDIKTGEVFEI